MHMNEQRYREPEPSVSAAHRRKLFILSAFGAVIIILIWLATFPLNYGKNEGSSAPAHLVNAISNDVQSTSQAIVDVQPGNTDEPESN